MWRGFVTPLSIFVVSSKNLKWKQHFWTDTSWNYLLLNMVVWWGCISRRGKGRGEAGGEWEPLMSNLCLISHRWYDVEKRTVPGSSNLNLIFLGAHQTFCVKNMKSKFVTFCFIKLNANRFPQDHQERVTLLCRS